MLRTVTTLAVTMLCTAVLVGCGGSSTDQPTAAASGSTAAGGSPSASGTPSAGSDGSKPADYTDAQACAWLKKALADSADVSTEVGVMAQLTIGLSKFFEDHGGLQNADGPAFDAATVRGCKALHDRAIKRAGITSFGSL